MATYFRRLSIHKRKTSWVTRSRALTILVVLAVIIGGTLTPFANASDDDYQWSDIGDTVNTQQTWESTASSADGTKLIAAAYGDFLYTSTDSGATWTKQLSAGDRYWQAVASSADGSKLTAADSGGFIYTSINGGLDWTEQTNSGARQ